MLLDTKSAAKVLGVSASLMKRWRADGEGPRFVSVGPRLIRYSEDDLNSYISRLTRYQNNGEVPAP
jgi:predicted DNA-binding transcriptional regulator AlpA